MDVICYTYVRIFNSKLRFISFSEPWSLTLHAIRVTLLHCTYVYRVLRILMEASRIKSFVSLVDWNISKKSTSKGWFFDFSRNFSRFASPRFLPVHQFESSQWQSSDYDFTQFKISYTIGKHWSHMSRNLSRCNTQTQKRTERNFLSSIIIIYISLVMSHFYAIVQQHRFLRNERSLKKNKKKENRQRERERENRENREQ